MDRASSYSLHLMIEVFVLSINSFSSRPIASESLFLRGVRIKQPMLKRRSTGAEEGRVALYLDT